MLCSAQAQLVTMRCLERGLTEDNVVVDARYPGSPSEPVAMARCISFVRTITVWHLRTRDTRPPLAKVCKVSEPETRAEMSQATVRSKGSSLGSAAIVQ